MKLVADVKLGMRIGKDIKNYLSVSERASKIAVTAETTSLKNALREDIKRAGLGERLSKTWQSKVYPEGGKVSMDASGFIYSKAAHIIGAYDKGAVIRARNARYMAVPLPEAQKFFAFGGRRRRITPEMFEKKFGYKLRFVKRPGKNPILVADGMRQSKSGTMARIRANKATKNHGVRSNLSRRATIPLFVLIPQVTIKKRLDVKKHADQSIGKLSDRLYQEKMRLLNGR